MLATLARIVLRRWATLLAIWLAAVVLRDVALHAAAEVGIHLPFLGGLLVSLAMLVRMTAFVATLLIVRDELDHVPPGEEGRGAFARSLVRATIPFAAFYLASGLLRQDWDSYVELAGRRMLALWMEDPPVLAVIGFTWPTAAVVVVCLVLRLAWGRWGGRLPGVLGAAAVLLELLWVYLTAFMLDDALANAWEWLGTRRVGVWLDGVHTWLDQNAPPLTLLWEGIAPASEAVLQVVIVPLAWLLTAATVYGGSLVVAERRRITALGRAARLASDHVDTVRDGAVLIRRTGPVLIGAYLLLFALIGALEPALFHLITRWIGPMGQNDPWQFFLGTLIVIPPAVVTPVLVLLVALCCNAAFQRGAARTDPGSAEVGDLGLEQDPRGGVGAVGPVDRERERTLGVAGHAEQGPHLGL